MIRNEILIEAEPATIWALTIDVERWPELTPTISEVTRLDHGPVALGSRARVKQPAQRAAVWTVSRFEPEADFEWWTKVGPVTMTGSHHLERTATGCLNVLTLELTGRGAGLAERIVGRHIGKAIATENQGFKKAAEALRA